jgi:hypothetical protein
MDYKPEETHKLEVAQMGFETTNRLHQINTTKKNLPSVKF